MRLAAVWTSCRRAAVSVQAASSDECAVDPHRAQRVALVPCAGGRSAGTAAATAGSRRSAARAASAARADTPAAATNLRLVMAIGSSVPWDQCLEPPLSGSFLSQQ
jgi:hypothetical protein